MAKKPLDIGSLFERSFEAYKQSIVAVLLFFIVAVGINIIFLALLFAALFGMFAPVFFPEGFRFDPLGPGIGWPLVGFSALLVLYFGYWCKVVYYEVISNPKKPFGQILREALPNALPYWLALFLPTMAVFGAAFLCVLPALFLAPLFAFIPFAFVKEGRRGFDAAARSWKLASANYWWTMLLVFIAILLPVAASMVPFIGGLLSLAVTPLSAFFLSEVFDDLKAEYPKVGDAEPAALKPLLFGGLVLVVVGMVCIWLFAVPFALKFKDQIKDEIQKDLRKGSGPKISVPYNP